MADIANSSFTGKPEDQDPQDFLNRLERIILMKTGLTEPEKVWFFELSLKAKSPAAAWLATLAASNKVSFATIRTAFELRWPIKPITEKTTAEKQALLDGTTLKMTDLGRRLSHIVWADKVERLAGEIPDTNNLLVASTRKRLPKPLLKLIGLKPMTWKELADAVRAITLEELMEKALGAAFQNINLTPQPHRSHTASQYPPQRAQMAPRTAFSTFIDRPAHERLVDVLHKALPIQPNNTEGIARYNIQISVWHSSYGQNGKGPSESRPYPLTPGSAPVASGECWTCGQRSHHPAPCSSPAVPTFKTKWWSIAQTIRKWAEAAAAPAINVNMMTAESDEVQAYDADELEHLQQLVDQGKADGSSM
ncbi:hypothetical protein BYT27DRAFT_7283416 [Phlegmacium glaucopus]|nr:hypothetical protein BYT27DRAFT_7283416 [Phlegmacium glaucopus]